jgi:hypothetical protein
LEGIFGLGAGSWAGVHADQSTDKLGKNITANRMEVIECVRKVASGGPKLFYLYQLLQRMVHASPLHKAPKINIYRHFLAISFS